VKRLLFLGPKCTTKPLKSAQGFTLIEVLVAMVIIGILATITVSNVRGNLPLWRLQGATNDVVGIFQKARALAVKNNRWALVVFTGVNSPTTCAVDIYLDMNSNGTVEASDPKKHHILLGSQYPKAYIKTSTAGGVAVTTVIMASDGTVKPSTLPMPITITLGSTVPSVTRTYQVIVERSGLPRIK